MAIAIHLFHVFTRAHAYSFLSLSPSSTHTQLFSRSGHFFSLSFALPSLYIYISIKWIRIFPYSATTGSTYVCSCMSLHGSNAKTHFYSLNYEDKRVKKGGREREREICNITAHAHYTVHVLKALSVNRMYMYKRSCAPTLMCLYVCNVCTCLCTSSGGECECV